MSDAWKRLRDETTTLRSERDEWQEMYALENGRAERLAAEAVPRAMNELARNGYRIVRLEQVSEAWSRAESGWVSTYIIEDEIAVLFESQNPVDEP